MRRRPAAQRGQAWSLLIADGHPARLPRQTRRNAGRAAGIEGGNAIRNSDQTDQLAYHPAETLGLSGQLLSCGGGLLGGGGVGLGHLVHLHHRHVDLKNPLALLLARHRDLLDEVAGMRRGNRDLLQ